MPKNFSIQYEAIDAEYSIEKVITGNEKVSGFFYTHKKQGNIIYVTIDYKHKRSAFKHIDKNGNSCYLDTYANHFYMVDGGNRRCLIYNNMSKKYFDKFNKEFKPENYPENNDSNKRWMDDQDLFDPPSTHYVFPSTLVSSNQLSEEKGPPEEKEKIKISPSCLLYITALVTGLGDGCLLVNQLTKLSIFSFLSHAKGAQYLLAFPFSVAQLVIEWKETKELIEDFRENKELIPKTIKKHYKKLIPFLFIVGVGALVEGILLGSAVSDIWNNLTNSRSISISLGVITFTATFLQFLIVEGRSIGSHFTDPFFSRDRQYISDTKKLNGILVNISIGIANVIAFGGVLAWTAFGFLETYESMHYSFLSLMDWRASTAVPIIGGMSAFISILNFVANFSLYGIEFKSFFYTYAKEVLSSRSKQENKKIGFIRSESIKIWLLRTYIIFLAILNSAVTYIGLNELYHLFISSSNAHHSETPYFYQWLFGFFGSFFGFLTMKTSGMRLLELFELEKLSKSDNTNNYIPRLNPHSSYENNSLELKDYILMKFSSEEQLSKIDSRTLVYREELRLIIPNITEVLSLYWIDDDGGVHFNYFNKNDKDINKIIQLMPHDQHHHISPECQKIIEEILYKEIIKKFNIPYRHHYAFFHMMQDAFTLIFIASPSIILEAVFDFNKNYNEKNGALSYLTYAQYSFLITSIFAVIAYEIKVKFKNPHNRFKDMFSASNLKNCLKLSLIINLLSGWQYYIYLMLQQYNWDSQKTGYGAEFIAALGVGMLSSFLLRTYLNPSKEKTNNEKSITYNRSILFESASSFESRSSSSMASSINLAPG